MRAGPFTVLAAGLLLSGPLAASTIAIDYSLTLLATDAHPDSREVDGRLTFHFDPLQPLNDPSFAVLSHDLTVDGTLFHALPKQNGTFGSLYVSDNATPGDDADIVYIDSDFDFFPTTPQVGRAFLWLVSPPSFFPTADGLWDFSKVYNSSVAFVFDSGSPLDDAYFFENLIVSASLVNEVPEPASFALFGTALLWMFAIGRKSRQGHAPSHMTHMTM